MAAEDKYPEDLNWLTTVSDARINVSLCMRGKDIVSDDYGSPAAWLEFSSATGQKKYRA